MSSTDFYDRLAPYYHLIFPAGFETSMTHQAAALDTIIQQRWGDRTTSILDVACGIGTQALGLARLGYHLTASDLSAGAIERARQEAAGRGLAIDYSVADMTRAYQHHQRQFDLVLAADNAVPHLLSEDAILKTFRQFYCCCRPGGGCLITVRDYEQEDLTGRQLRPYGLRVEDGVRYLVFQIWDFDQQTTGSDSGSDRPPTYEVSMYFLEDRGNNDVQTHVMRARYFAIGVTRLINLMETAGFEDVKRVDDIFFQPVIVGTRPVTDGA